MDSCSLLLSAVSIKGRWVLITFARLMVPWNWFIFIFNGHPIPNIKERERERENTAKTNGIPKPFCQNQGHQSKPQTDLFQNHKNSPYHEYEGTERNYNLLWLLGIKQTFQSHLGTHILLEKQSSVAVGIIHSTTCAANTFSFM